MRKIMLIIGIAAAAVIGTGYGLNELSQARSFQLYGGLVGHIETEHRVAALTFDDGPGVFTGEILRILREEGVKGTFFLTGSEIERYPDEAVRIVEEGHEIGNHTFSHQRMVFKSPSFIREELEQTDEWIRRVGYEGDIHFRPPYGRRLMLLPRYLAREGRLTILWNIEPEANPDTAADPDLMVEHVVEHIVPGSIILLHVMYESRRPSLEAVQPIIAALKEQGYTFVTVSELLGYADAR